MKKTLTAMTVLLLAASAHAQVFQCVENGRKVFSDKPCGQDAKPLEVRPSSGRVTPSSPQSAGANEAAQKQSQDDLSKRADLAVKKRLLDEEIYRKEQRLKSLRSDMEQKLADLREKKRNANNNLAGATWENSISQEMNSVVASYDSQFRFIEGEISALRSQRATLDKP
jgi:hypothetical protein